MEAKEAITQMRKDLAAVKALERFALECALWSPVRSQDESLFIRPTHAGGGRGRQADWDANRSSEPIGGWLYVHQKTLAATP